MSEDKRKDGIEEEALSRWLSEIKSLPSSPAFSERVMREIESRPNPHASRRPTRSRYRYRLLRGWLDRLGSMLAGPRPALAGAAATFILGFGLASLVFLGQGGAPAPGPQRTLVHFSLHAPAAHQVALVGNFNHWRSRYPLHRAANGTWVATVALPPGRYEYSFVVNSNRWVKDPAAARYSNDGFGSQNAVITVNAGSA